MSESPLAVYEFRRGALRGSHLSLSATRLMHRGNGFHEVLPLGHIAAVRVAYEREPARMGQAAVLGIVALIVLAVTRPLQAALAFGLAELGAQPQGGSRFLLAALQALDLLAAVLPAVALGLALWGALRFVHGWLGYTALTVLCGAGERVYTAPRRDAALFEFGDALSDRL